MKKPISIKLDENLWVFIKNKTNKSRYFEELVKQDIQMKQMKPIVKAVADELLGNEVFIRELFKRVGSIPTVAQASVASQNNSQPFVPRPPDPATGYPCCNQSKPCKHWAWNATDSIYKNELTGKVREPDL